MNMSRVETNQEGKVEKSRAMTRCPKCNGAVNEKTTICECGARVGWINFCKDNHELKIRKRIARLDAILRSLHEELAAFQQPDS
jgi:predicted HAD superfamily hydrolase